jgi:hypothetical protein
LTAGVMLQAGVLTHAARTQQREEAFGGTLPLPIGFLPSHPCLIRVSEFAWHWRGLLPPHSLGRI